MPINLFNKNIIYHLGTTAARTTFVNNRFIYFNTKIKELRRSSIIIRYAI